jgi:murein DD-endopeptidase MepM/ murein hydrolase activator NlpD
VTVGQTVTAGQQVATMGMTGDTEFVHLHFETRVQTTCSLPYQSAHPESSCAVGFDPHVHPYLFVGGANSDDLQISEIAGEHYTIRYVATRGDLDLDTIETDLGLIGFDTRAGLDATSIEHLDDFDYGWLRIVPINFGTANETLEYDLEFRVHPAFLELHDIWGHGLRFGSVVH